MTIVGAGDAWLFVSSTGGLTAGRVAPDSALFPYYTDDKVAESAGRTGGLSLLRVTTPGSDERPVGAVHVGQQVTDGVRRALYKDVAGTALVFEETRADLGLRMRVTWQTSEPVRHRAHQRADQHRRPAPVRSSSSMGSSTCSRQASTSTSRTG